MPEHWSLESLSLSQWTIQDLNQILLDSKLDYLNDCIMGEYIGYYLGDNIVCSFKCSNCTENFPFHLVFPSQSFSASDFLKDMKTLKYAEI